MSTASSRSPSLAQSSAVVLPDPRSALSFSRVLLCLERLSSSSSDAHSAASELIRCYATPLLQWTEVRRTATLGAADERQRQSEQALDAAAADSALLHAQHADNTQSLLAVNSGIARWERQREQYSELKERTAARVEAEAEAQRHWQSAAMQHVQQTTSAGPQHQQDGHEQKQSVAAHSTQHCSCKADCSLSSWPSLLLQCPLTYACVLLHWTAECVVLV